eukprot:XP_019925519.1 PREDICTED: fucolectin-like [Crassostrea gigas]
MNSLGDTFPVSNVLDGINGNDCNRSNVFGSGKEENPWLEITWSGAITIWRIIIYNRVDCCGDRLVNVNVTYSIKGVVEICGFYPGLLSRDGDVIMFFCPPEARASSVKLQIQSKSGQVDYLMLCEVEIYRKK